MLGLALVLVLGVFVQCVAWRLRLPSILLLLLTGFALGPGLGFVDPDEMLGEMLFPIVSLAVALILFEGGLTLRVSELRGRGWAALGMIVVGAPVAWGLTTWFALQTLDLALGPSLLLGAILIVTGPTVIGPLLAFVRPSGPSGAVLRWEGIVNDPVGAILAVLVFTGMTVVDAGDGFGTVAMQALTATVVGLLLGALAALALVVALRRYIVPDHLASPFAFALALAAFVASNEVVHESGLLAVTLMGILLANQRFVAIESIIVFKENLRVLLLSSLFLLLSARVAREDLLIALDPRAMMFLAALVFVVRPATVLFSTIGGGLSWREKAFVAWMAPRGIVAAAISSVFGLELTAAGIDGGERLASVVLLVIVGTVSLYGLTAAPVARALGLARRTREGVLIFGANSVARALASGLHEAGVEVLVVDTDREEVQKARLDGLPARYGSVFDEKLADGLAGLGRMLTLSWSDTANSLAVHSLSPLFGSDQVFQLDPDNEPGVSERVPHHLRGRTPFEKGLTLSDLSSSLRAGAAVRCTPITEEFGLDELREVYGAGMLPLAVLTGKSVHIVRAADEPDVEPGDRLLHLSMPPPEPRRDSRPPKPASPVSAG